jgi:hypothetical protein
MRAAEQPLEPNLDVAGLKERERERKELQAGVGTVADEHGRDAGVVKAAMSK